MDGWITEQPRRHALQEALSVPASPALGRAQREGAGEYWGPSQSIVRGTEMTPRPTPQARPLPRPTVSTSSHSDGYDPSPGLGAASRFPLRSLHRFSLLLLAFIRDREDQSTVHGDPEQTLPSVQPLKSYLFPWEAGGGLVPLPPPGGEFSSIALSPSRVSLAKLSDCAGAQPLSPRLLLEPSSGSGAR